MLNRVGLGQQNYHVHDLQIPYSLLAVTRFALADKLGISQVMWGWARRPHFARVALPGKQLHECFLLYVEDDDATAYLFQTALQETDLSPQFFRATDGEHALRFLLQDGPYSTAPRPDLVLLDLNLPRKSGFDVLAEIKGNPRLCGIKVVVFSTSTLPYDRERSLQLGAEDYISKDGQFDTFITVAKSVCQTRTSRIGPAPAAARPAPPGCR
jgi:two-component system, chemotaxis family, response regulator Rcp1